MSHLTILEITIFRENDNQPLTETVSTALPPHYYHQPPLPEMNLAVGFRGVFFSGCLGRFFENTGLLVRLASARLPLLRLAVPK